MLIKRDLYARILQKKREFDGLRPFPKAALERLKERIVVEWTYNSNAIEGNTLTLKETRMVLEDGLTIGKKSLKSDSIPSFTYRLYRQFIVRNVDTGPFFYPMSCHHHLVKHAAPENEGVAQALNQKVCVLPSYPGLQQKELKKIAQHVLKFIKA